MFIETKQYKHSPFVNKQVNLVTTILFIICIIPHSFMIGGQGVSGNYLFAIFPIFHYLYSKNFNRPTLEVYLFMALLFCICIFAFLFQPNYIEISIRRFASFAVFMCLFAFMFVRIDSDMIESFKKAIVLWSIYSSLSVLTLYIDLGGAELATYAKGAVGSTRIGFVYIVALWIIYFYQTSTFLMTVLKHFIAFIILMGLVLTFSRASVFALLISTLSYFLVITINYIKEKKTFIKIAQKLLVSFTYCIALTIILHNIFPPAMIQYNKYNEQIKQFAFSSIGLEKSSKTNISEPGITNISEPGITNISESNKIYSNNQELKSASKIKKIENFSSIGYRVYIFNEILDFVIRNPLTGSGFFGVWIMSDEKVGSAHGQFSDVLFRIGFIGFFVYMYFVFKILRFLYFKDLSLFISFIGMLFYGLLHETFKLSQGAFIFAFLFAMYDQRDYLISKSKSSKP